MSLRQFRTAFRLSLAALCLAALLGPGAGLAADAPRPLLAKGQAPVPWWFGFKFNAASFPLCGGGADTRACLFGGTKQSYPKSEGFSQQFIFASPGQPLA